MFWYTSFNFSAKTLSVFKCERIHDEDPNHCYPNIMKLFATIIVTCYVKRSSSTLGEDYWHILGDMLILMIRCGKSKSKSRYLFDKLVSETFLVQYPRFFFAGTDFIISLFGRMANRNLTEEVREAERMSLWLTVFNENWRKFVRRTYSI